MFLHTRYAAGESTKKVLLAEGKRVKATMAGAHVRTCTTHTYGPSDAAAAVMLHVGTRACIQNLVFGQMLRMLTNNQDDYLMSCQSKQRLELWLH